MSIEKIHQLLTDESRPGAPEPTLLPWLTRRIAPSGLSVAAAAGAGILSARDRWPVIADSVAAIVAERQRDPGLLAEALGILPPVAGHLGAEAAATINWARTGPDAVCYATLGGLPPELLGSALPTGLVARPLWGPILAASPMPVLADIRSLRWLAVARLVDIGTETDQQAVYLLPSRSGPRAHWQAMEAIEAAVRTDRHWYTAALLARAAPYLG